MCIFTIRGSFVFACCYFVWDNTYTQHKPICSTFDYFKHRPRLGDLTLLKNKKAEFCISILTSLMATQIGCCLFLMIFKAVIKLPFTRSSITLLSTPVDKFIDFLCSHLPVMVRYKFEGGRHGYAVPLKFSV